MSDSPSNLTGSLSSTSTLEERLNAAATQTRVGPLDTADLRHLTHVLTSYSLVVTPLDDLIHFNDLIDVHFYPSALRMLTAAEPDEEALHRVLSVPEHVRVLGDKCLFEAGVARREGPRGLDLEELGRRSYAKASRILSALSRDRRLRRFFDENLLHRNTIEDEVAFLSRCADAFSGHVRLLHALLDVEPAWLTPPSAAESPLAMGLASPAASTALAPVQRPPVPSARRATAPGEPDRVVDLHVTSRTDEEVAQERFRDLVALEKTLLFSMLDTERLRDELKKVVIHQEGAIDSLCDELALYSTGTQDPRKPASYFLVGPTGVGKNYMVECLLRLFERLWGIEVPYLEIEGPEYTYPSDINELKGATRGFIRSDEEGIMTKFHERAHDKPISVILVDEVEKAHPQLRKFFLGIMDRGVMTDNRGRVLHFPNTMIFFTSNIGYSDAQQSTAPIGFGDETARDRNERASIDGSLRKSLSPEFVNRLHVIHFAHLTRKAVDEIFDLELDKIRRRYASSQGLDIEVTAAAREELLRQGFHRDYGARNLAKALNRAVNVEISKTLARDAASRPSDVGGVLDMLREMREGKGSMDLERARDAVREASRMRVPYSRIVVDFTDGELRYGRG